MYDGFKCEISHEGKLSDFIEVRSGVRHVRMYSVSNPVSANIRQSHGKSERFTEKGNTVEYEGKIEDVDYVDVICLLALRFCGMEEKLKRLKEEAELVGLHININKTKGMTVNTANM